MFDTHTNLILWNFKNNRFWAGFLKWCMSIWISFWVLNRHLNLNQIFSCQRVKTKRNHKEKLKHHQHHQQQQLKKKKFEFFFITTNNECHETNKRRNREKYLSFNRVFQLQMKSINLVVKAVVVARLMRVWTDHQNTHFFLDSSSFIILLWLKALVTWAGHHSFEFWCE